MTSVLLVCACTWIIIINVTGCLQRRQPLRGFLSVVYNCEQTQYLQHHMRLLWPSVEWASVHSRPPTVAHASATEQNSIMRFGGSPARSTSQSYKGTHFIYTRTKIEHSSNIMHSSTITIYWFRHKTNHMQYEYIRTAYGDIYRFRMYMWRTTKQCC